MNWIFLLFHKARKSVSLNMGNLIVKSTFFDTGSFEWLYIFLMFISPTCDSLEESWEQEAIVSSQCTGLQTLSVSSSFFWSYHCHLYEIHLTYLYFLAYLLPLYREHFHKNWVILQKKFQDEKDKLKWMEYSLTGSIKKFHPIIFSV